MSASEPGFESPPVHPLERTPDGTLLLAVNTADHRLSVFDLTQGPLPVLVAEIPVGLEPVTVRARSNSEAWVVNHLSDSITRVDLAGLGVTATFLVGDEPTDVVFAGAPERAFVCLSQEDRVLVLDAATGGEVSSLPLEASDPRSLALSPAKDRVYVSVLDSGNGTTAVGEQVVDATLGLPPADPAPDASLLPLPATALIVRNIGGVWQDEAGRNWNAFVPYTVLDHDVAVLDVATASVLGYFGGVGTSVFNVAANPVTGLLYAGNQEADNLTRFEPNLRGRFVATRVTTVDPGTGTAVPVNLNPHIDYGTPAGTDPERAQSLAFPLDFAISDDGQDVYVAAFGSARVGVLDAAGAVVDRIPVGHGPAGLALDGSTLYVLNAIDATISVVDLTGPAVQEIDLGFDVVADPVRNGRRLFYDAENSSAHGDLACASCHLFGGMDNLAWDLGDPTGEIQPPPANQPGSAGFHPMKGPMTTQSLKGLTGTEPLHWRGDRAALADFNGAFVSLQGRGAELSPGEFADFEAFVLSMAYPPNPLRNLDGSLPDPVSGPNPTTGEQLYLTGNLVGGLQCVTCHTLPTGENGAIIPAAALQESQDMVVPQLRNLYEKTRFDDQAATTVRGFGYIHSGAVDDLFTFLQFPGFSFAGDADREHVASFLLHFDTGTHAAVGAQWTMDGTNAPAGTPRIEALENVAGLGEIDLVVKGRDGLDDRGWLYAGGAYTPDRAGEPAWTRGDLLALAGPGTELTWTAVPAGCGARLGLDRDSDGHRDTDETDAGSDPADPLSTPATVGIPDPGAAAGPGFLRAVYPNPARAGRATLELALEDAAPVTVRVHDVQGRVVRTLLDGERLPAGNGTRTWDLRDDAGRAVPGGIYFVRVVTPDAVEGTRLVVIR